MKTSIALLILASFSASAETCMLIKDREMLQRLQEVNERALRDLQTFNTETRQCLKFTGKAHTFCLFKASQVLTNIEKSLSYEVQHNKEELKRCK
ncbi:MAG: hypothetical protein ACRDCY_18165 [Aeromonas veronii]